MIKHEEHCCHDEIGLCSCQVMDSAHNNTAHAASEASAIWDPPHSSHECCKRAMSAGSPKTYAEAHLKAMGLLRDARAMITQALELLGES